MFQPQRSTWTMLAVSILSAFRCKSYPVNFCLYGHSDAQIGGVSVLIGSTGLGCIYTSLTVFVRLGKRAAPNVLTISTDAVVDGQLVLDAVHDWLNQIPASFVIALGKESHRLALGDALANRGGWISSMPLLRRASEKSFPLSGPVDPA